MEAIPDLVGNPAVAERSLGQVLEALLQSASEPSLSVATAYFRLQALESLSSGLARVASFRLLLGKEQERDFMLGRDVRAALEEESAKPAQNLPPTVARWLDLLRQEKVQIRQFRRGFLHGKAYLVDGVPTLGSIGIVGSSNLTRGGLEGNFELNAVLKQTSAVEDLRRWFEDAWSGAEECKDELLEVLSRFTAQYTPYELYVKVLYEALKDRLQMDLREEADRPSPLALADFQKDGSAAAREILDHYGGVLLADSVGMGKTYLAVDLLVDYAYHQMQPVLKICPAALRDSIWGRRGGLLEQAMIAGPVVSMEWLSRAGEEDLEELTQYKVIVVDESHNFRNHRSNRWQNLFRLLRKGPPDKKLILLTATPVNNSVFDLHNQLRLITRDADDFFADVGIPGLRNYFRRSDRDKDVLYELLEAVAVRRSRPFVRKNYPDAMIEGKPLRFPKRALHAAHYSLEESYGGELYQQVAHAIENLLFAPYRVDTFRHDVLRLGKPEAFGDDATSLMESLKTKGWSQKEAQDFTMTVGRQTALAHIMRVLYLKRFESSVEALKISLRRQRGFQARFLEALQKGKVLDAAACRKWVQAESADDPEDSATTDEVIKELPPLDASKYDVASIRKAVETDVQTLDELLRDLERLTPEADDKLTTLKSLLAGSLKSKKVLLFTYFRETARYLLSHLAGEGVEIIDGSVDADTRTGRIFRFAPRANNRRVKPEKEIATLISTDVLSEGQNLQDAEVVVNYDLHWNPVRMVQRAGRVDRIGCPHDNIHVYNFFPEAALEGLLGLMQRLDEKLDAINRSVGLDASVLGERPNPMDFNTLRRMDGEDQAVLEELESESELSVGEFLEQDLLDFIRRIGEEKLEAIPLGMGTGKAGKGKQGFFAAFRHSLTQKHYWLFEEEGGRIVEERLRAIAPVRCGPEEKPVPLPEDFDPVSAKKRLLDRLVGKLRSIAHRMLRIPSPQNAIVSRLKAMAPSAKRNEVLGYLGRPLDGPSLKALRKLWREKRGSADAELVEALREFVDSHPSPAPPATEAQEVRAEDFECIAWIALV